MRGGLCVCVPERASVIVFLCDPVCVEEMIGRRNGKTQCLCSGKIVSIDLLKDGEGVDYTQDDATEIGRGKTL